MEILWRTDSSLTVRQVSDGLSQSLAHTTVMTVLDRLAKKGFARRERDGRAWRYRPAATREAYVAELMLTALEQTGDRDAALARFAQSVSGAEAVVLRDALSGLERERQGNETEGDSGVGLWGHWPTRYFLPRSPWGACDARAACCAPAGRAGPRRPRFCCGRPSAWPAASPRSARCSRSARAASRRDRESSAAWPRSPRRLAYGQQVAPDQPLVLTCVRLTALVAGFALFTALCGVLVMAFADAVAARRRQRELLALLAHGDPKVPGALVIDYPAAAAYCLPGIRSQIVVSVGTLDLLAPAELTAVLAHERAHLRARHDLVLIPFTSLRRALPRSRVIAQSYQTVALLVEMMADDRALRVRGLLARELATALLRFGTAGTDGAPAGALAAAEGELTARVNRLLAPQPPLPRAAQATVILAAAVLVATPLLLLVIP